MMNLEKQLQAYELLPQRVVHNASTAGLYEAALCSDGGKLTESGALATCSGLRTGRSPNDRRIVENPESQHDVWWGDVNMPLRPMSYRINRRRAVDFLNSQKTIYVVDGFVGWDPNHRLKVRLVAARPYHALFMQNMLIRPTATELEEFDSPDFVILNAGAFPADPLTPDVTSDVSVNINFEAGEMVILGTEYAGEMKKGIFSVMHYLLPQQDVLTLHAAANEGARGDVSLLVGLSGTGKTTLSADPRRRLIGDDELGWSREGVFNLEGGCYAKCHGLSPDREPVIHRAIRFGCVLENTTLDSHTRDVDFQDTSRTINTRASYPIQSVPDAKIPCVGEHPRNVIFLTCDAFGVFPPVSKLTPEQARYHFLNGYTAKVGGTEFGVNEPRATFSPCYGAAFLTRPPARYADLLMERIHEHAPDLWLVNTGWLGGDCEQGQRISLETTRAILRAIHDQSLAREEMRIESAFGLQVPVHCPNVPDEMLDPRNAWLEPAEYDAAACHLKQRFRRNYERLDHQILQLTSHTAEYHRATF